MSEDLYRHLSNDIGKLVLDHANVSENRYNSLSKQGQERVFTYVNQLDRILSPVELLTHEESTITQVKQQLDERLPQFKMALADLVEDTKEVHLERWLWRDRASTVFTGLSALSAVPLAYYALQQNYWGIGGSFFGMLASFGMLVYAGHYSIKSKNTVGELEDSNDIASSADDHLWLTVLNQQQKPLRKAVTKFMMYTRNGTTQHKRSA